MHKMTTHEIDIALSDLFKISPFSMITRGHPYKICLEKIYTELHKSSFLCRSVLPWNNLDNKSFVYKKASLFQLHLIQFFLNRNENTLDFLSDLKV